MASECEEAVEKSCWGGVDVWRRPSGCLAKVKWVSGEGLEGLGLSGCLALGGVEDFDGDGVGLFMVDQQRFA